MSTGCQAHLTYITEYQFKAKNDQSYRLSQLLGLDEVKLREMMKLAITASNINEYGRFEKLKDSVDPTRAKAYFEKLAGTTIPAFKVNIKIDELLRDFILRGGFEVVEKVVEEKVWYDQAAEEKGEYRV